MGGLVGADRVAGDHRGRPGRAPAARLRGRGRGGRGRGPRVRARGGGAVVRHGARRGAGRGARPVPVRLAGALVRVRRRRARSPSRGRVQRRANVVLVVLDELPTASLMDARGRLDARRLPGFAALARDATWYRNAASPSDYTQLAVPVDPHREAAARGHAAGGLRAPRQPLHPARRRATGSMCSRRSPTSAGRRARARSASRSGAASAGSPHRRSTAVPALPPKLSNRLSDAIAPEGPPERRGRAAGDRRRRAARAVHHPGRPLRALPRHVTPRREPTLNYLHLVLPHRPWRLPARRPALRRPAPVPRRVRALAVATPRWRRPPGSATCSRRGYVDRLLARLIATAEGERHLRPVAGGGRGRPRGRVPAGRGVADRDRARTSARSRRCRCS